MAQAIGTYAAKKILGKQMDKYKDKDVSDGYDPYFQTIEYTSWNGKKKSKKVKKQIPDYIPEHDARILAKMRQRSYTLDCSLFNFLGTRFGWSSIIGLVPIAGDSADALFAFLLVLRCCKVDCKLDNSTKFWMVVNIVFDWVIGFIPIFGDLFDAYYKANTKNLRLLEERLDKVYKPKQPPNVSNRASQILEEMNPASVPQEFSDDEHDLPSFINGDGIHERYEPRRPEPVRQKTETRGGPSFEKSRGWFNWGSRRETEPDLERGKTWN